MRSCCHGTVLLLFIATCFRASGGEPVSWWQKGQARDLAPHEWERVYREDARNLQQWHVQLEHATPALVGIARTSSPRVTDPIPPAEKELACSYWVQLADLSIGINARADFHRDFVTWVDKDRQANHIRAFLLCDVADLMIHDAGLRVTDAFAGNPKWMKVLNESQPRLGLPQDSYSRFRDQIHNLERGSRQFLAMQYLKGLKLLPAFKSATADAETAWLFEQAERYHERVHQDMLSHGIKYALRQTGDVTAALAFRAWFPVQKSVANTMGNVKFKRPGAYMSTPGQVREMCAKLQPGDIGVSRKNWYLSNAGIPGFWPHAFMYVGPREQMEKFFDDEEVKAWCARQDAQCTSLADLLANRYPSAWQKYTAAVTARQAHERGVHVTDPNGEETLYPAFIESIAPGVVFRMPEETLAADYIGILRPRVSKVGLARALDRAFSHAGKPYDYDFDFTTDAQLVCSELVFKSFQPAEDFRGLNLKLEEAMGRALLPPNSIIKKFDAEFDDAGREFDFVAFLDGREAEGCCAWGTADELRKSWQRPKWDVLQK